jgi:hypothetical protein
VYTNNSTLVEDSFLSKFSESIMQLWVGWSLIKPYGQW